MNESKEARELVEKIANKSLAQRIREKRELVRVGKEAYDRVVAQRRQLLESVAMQLRVAIDNQRTMQSVCRNFVRHQSDLNRLLDIAKEAQDQRCTIAEAEERVTARQAVLNGVRNSMETLLSWANDMGVAKLVEELQRHVPQTQASRLRAEAGLGESVRYVEQLSILVALIESFQGQEQTVKTQYDRSEA